MKHGGRRAGAGRPKTRSPRQKHRTVLEVALSLSAPAEWEASQPSGGAQLPLIPSSARYRPSAASVIRSSIPAAAIRRQEIEVNAGRARRSLSEIEAELAEHFDAQTCNDTTTTGLRRMPLEAFQDGYLDSVIKPREHLASGSSLSDFLMEDFYDGTKQPGELRGLKWIR